MRAVNIDDRATVMMSPRVLFWVLWIFGTMTQAFGFLFAQVPRSDSRFLGGVLLLACGSLAGSVLLGRGAWKSVPAGGHTPASVRRMTPIEGVATVVAIFQLCICLYWVLDLVIYAMRR